MSITHETLILELPLSIRTINGLMNSPKIAALSWRDAKVATFRDIKDVSDEDLLAVPNIGKKSLREWTHFRDKVLGIAPEIVPIHELDALLLAHKRAMIELDKIWADLRKALLKVREIEIQPRLRPYNAGE